MSSIQEYLGQILQAVYGKDVRKAIHDAINQCYIDASAGITPIISIESITGGTKVYITLGDVTQSFVIENGTASAEDVETYVNAWLEEHPEASSTILDGTVSKIKLASDVIAEFDDLDDRVTTIEDNIYSDIESYINNWLDEHPEATTSVEDGSLTYSKLALGTLGFVIPEMFGAVGDGVTDDSEPIQDAINSGYPVLFGKKEYLISQTIELYDLRAFELNAENATIIYTGSDYAFAIRSLRYSVLKFGSIVADNGGCFYFDGTLYSYWSQYVDIYFKLLQAVNTSPCVYANATATWINEIRWHSGRIASGLYAFRLVRSSTEHNITHWRFSSIGIEGVTTGFKFESADDDSGKGISSFIFDGCRYEESFTTLIHSTGRVKNMTFYGSGKFPVSKISTDSDATDWVVYGSGGGLLKLVNGIWSSESNYYALSGGILITTGADLDDFTEFGNYYCNQNTVASSLQNCPTNNAFTLIVENRASDIYRRQVLRNYNDVTYERRLYTSDNGQTWTFGDWVSDEWVNVSTSITYDSDIVTGGALIMYYNAKLGLAMLSGTLTVSLSQGSNVLGVIGTKHRSSPYYNAISASWEKPLTARIVAHDKITVKSDEAYTGTLAVSGIWKTA